MRTRWFYLLLLLLGLIQCYGTELLNDEAYYWYYSQHLDWGYFDHPPLVGLLAKCGGLLFSGEFGVRVVGVILHVLSIFLIEKTILPKNKPLFYWVVLGVGALHVFGWLMIPDNPLLFSTALFFFLLKKQLERKQFLLTIATGVAMALLLYSKYHGIMVILFTMMGYPALCRKKWFWISSGLGALLFLPHLIWQYDHEWVTFRFHLYERNREEWNIFAVRDYLLGQLGMVGPFLGFFILGWITKKRERHPFRRILKTTTLGMLLFCFGLSWMGRTEGNWTVVILVPMVMLGYLEAEGNEKRQRRIRVGGYLGVSLVLLVRLVFLLDSNGLVIRDFRRNSDWAEHIEEKAGDLPVVFLNSYQRASKYQFYTGKKAYSRSNFNYAGSHYDLTNEEEKLIGKRVWVHHSYVVKGMEEWEVRPGENLRFSYIESFQSYNSIWFRLIKQKREGNSLICDVEIEKYGSKGRLVQENECVASIFHKKKRVKCSPIKWTSFEEKAGEPLRATVCFDLPETEGEYAFRLGLKTGWLPSGRNSFLYKVK